MTSASETAPVARLAASQLKRIRRIVDAAVALAEEGGFDGVRLRDVAEASGVALGTLYKYFRSKEDVLLFALMEEVERLEGVLATRPPVGSDAVERLVDLFSRATRVLTRRPAFAHAVLRSIASGAPETAAKVASFHLRTTRLIVATLRGESSRAGTPDAEPAATTREQSIAMVLNHVWFATLLGWSGGLHPTRVVTERMREAIELLVAPS
jgi:AcrR family transcriptional regulator